MFEEPVCLGTHYPDGDARDGHLAYGFAILSDPSPPASADHEEEEKEKDGDNSKFAHSFLAASSSFYDNRVQLWSI